MRWATATGAPPGRGSRTKKRRVPMPWIPSTRVATGLTPWKSYSSHPSAPTSSSVAASAWKSNP